MVAALAALRAEGVLARRYFFPGCHRMAPYRDGAVPLPVTEAACDRVIQLPTGTAVGTAQVDEVAALIRLIAAGGAAVEARLAQG